MYSFPLSVFGCAALCNCKAGGHYAIVLHIMFSGKSLHIILTDYAHNNAHDFNEIMIVIVHSAYVQLKVNAYCRYEA